METTFKAALESAMKISGRSLRSIAIAAGVSYEQLKSLNQGKSQKTNVDDAMKVAAAFNVSLEDFYEGNLGRRRATIAVPGRAGAGAEVHLVDDYAKGDGLFHVECPSQLSPHGIVAVEVEGTGMEPAYAEGDLLFYSRDTMGVPNEAIGRMCVCHDENDRCWIKQVKAGTKPGLFNLLSINPTGANMHDVRLVWAAPVKLHLPREFVRKV
jgi:phage repressor protein C with HTH and peptisase S24 domain